MENNLTDEISDRLTAIYMVQCEGCKSVHAYNAGGIAETAEHFQGIGFDKIKGVGVCCPTCMHSHKK
jgi:hypothetical protein